MSESRLFAYGTLLFPEVRQALIGEVAATLPVVLRGYARHTVRHPGWAPFPAIVPRPGAEVAGLLLYDLDADAQLTLDRFERIDTGLYRKAALTVRDDAGCAMAAVSYVAGTDLFPHLTGPWDPDAFRRDQLTRFMERVIGRSCI